MTLYISAEIRAERGTIEVGTIDRAIKRVPL